MQVFINFGKFKTTVVFIHGYSKNYNDFNVTDSGKNIEIESHIRKVRNTVLVSLSDNDYLKSIEEVSTDIFEQLKSLSKTKIICVCHSYGAFYGVSLAKQYPEFVNSLILLDPSIKTNEFLEYLKTLDPNAKNKFQIDHFDDFPEVTSVPNHIPIIAHVNVASNSTIDSHIIELDKAIKKNVESKLMIHIDTSHMIHYKIPHVIMKSIKSI